MNWHILEWISSSLNMYGSGLIMQGSRKAFRVFLIGNFIYLTFAIHEHLWGFSVMEAWFLVTNIVAIRKNLLAKE